MNNRPSPSGKATVPGAVHRSPSIRAMELGTAVRQGNLAAMSLGFHALAAEPGNRHPTEVGGLAGLGAQLLDFGQTQGRSLTAEERDFAALLIRKIVGLLEAVDGEKDDVNLPAWRARLAGLCPVPSRDTLPANPQDSVVGGDETEPSARGLVILNRDLNEIFSEEFRRQLVALEELLETLQERSAQGQPVEKIREDIDECVHTISGNCRNLRFDELATCVEASLVRLQLAQSDAEFQTVYADFRNSLELLRIAWSEITETGSYSSALAAKLVAAGDSGDHFVSEPVDEPAIVMEGTPERAPEPVGVTANRDPEVAAVDIRRVFLEETEGILGRIGQVFQHWQKSGPSDTTWSVVRRELHSLKGAVTAAGRDEVSHFIHEVETLFGNVRMQDDHQREEWPALLEDIHGALMTALGLQGLGESRRLSDVRQRIAGFLSQEKPGGPEAEHPPVLEEMVGSWRVWMRDSGVSFDGDGASLLRSGSEFSLRELIHASGELDLVWAQLQHTLDATRMNLELLRVGRVSILEGLQAMEAHAGMSPVSNSRHPRTTGDLAGSESPGDERLHQGFRELSGRLSQLQKVEQELVRHASDLEGVLEKQRNLGDRLKSGLKGARMVSLGEYLPHLRYLVREIAKKAGKEVDLSFEGGDLQIDRLVIESMMTCFGHLIRNAVVHGIEPSAERQQAGKVPRGTLAISLSMQGSELMVRFSDDGTGLPMDRILSRAMEQGLVDRFGQVSQANVLRIITEPGFSTAPTLKLESGRGMGMDIVYQTVRQIGGSMQITPSADSGVGFLFRLPATLAVTPALLVRVGHWRFAFRSHCVERLLRVSRDDLLIFGAQRVLEVDGVQVPVVLLRPQGDAGDDTTDSSVMSVVIVRLVNRLAAFEVDEFIDSMDLLGRSPGTQLLSIPEIAGVTVLPDSCIIPILDPEAFVHRIDNEGGMADEGRSAVRHGKPHRVLVVDDSAMVRTVMQQELEHKGIVVDTADDGLSALEMLERKAYDLMLVDIEMPRMNGFELLRQLKEHPEECRPPTIVITSESGEDYRQQAMELGADGYMTRPYDLSELSRMMDETVAGKGGGD